MNYLTTNLGVLVTGDIKDVKSSAVKDVKKCGRDPYVKLADSQIDTLVVKPYSKYLSYDAKSRRLTINDKYATLSYDEYSGYRAIGERSHSFIVSDYNGASNPNNSVDPRSLPGTNETVELMGDIVNNFVGDSPRPLILIIRDVDSKKFSGERYYIGFTFNDIYYLEAPYKLSHSVDNLFTSNDNNNYNYGVEPQLPIPPVFYPNVKDGTYFRDEATLIAIKDGAVQASFSRFDNDFIYNYYTNGEILSKIYYRPDSQINEFYKRGLLDGKYEISHVIQDSVITHNVNFACGIIKGKFSHEVIYNNGVGYIINGNVNEISLISFLAIYPIILLHILWVSILDTISQMERLHYYSKIIIITTISSL